MTNAKVSFLNGLHGGELCQKGFRRISKRKNQEILEMMKVVDQGITRRESER